MPTNTFDSVPQSLTQRALAANFSTEELSRREQAGLTKDFYFDKQEQQLTLTVDDVDPATFNTFKPVIKKRTGLLYRKPLVRDFKGPSQSVAFLELLYKDNRIDTLLKNVDLLSELTGSALVFPQQDDELESGYRLKMYDASQFSVIPDDDNTNEISALSLVTLRDRLNKRSTVRNPQVERVLHQQIWTNDAVVTYEGTTSSPTAGNVLLSSEANELGFIPFFNWRGEFVHDQYIGHAPALGLRKLQQIVNQHLTNLGYIIKMQGFTPIAVSGYQSGEAVTLHPGKILSIPAGANASVLDTKPEIKEILEVIKYLEEKVFETGSVPKVAVVGGEGESGRELLVRFFPLLQVFEEKAVQFSTNELDLANFLLRVAGLPKIESVMVDWPQEDIIPLSLEEDTIGDDIKFGLTTPIDILLQRNPELTEQKAEAEVRANMDFNAEMGYIQSPEEKQAMREATLNGQINKDKDKEPTNKEEEDNDPPKPKDNKDKDKE